MRGGRGVEWGRREEGGRRGEGRGEAEGEAGAAGAAARPYRWLWLWVSADALGSGLLGVGNGKSPPITSWGKGSVEDDSMSPEGGGRVNTGSPHIIFLKIKCSELNL